MSTSSKPLCVRLPDDLHLAVIQLAQDNGMSPSEWMRDMLFRLIYGAPPGIEEGYLQGRNIGIAAAMKTIHLAVKNAIDAMPGTVEEAMPLTQLGSPGRRRHED